MYLNNLVSYVLKDFEKKTKKIKYSENAKELILGTIAQESAFGKYRTQLGKGPAKGIIQMEGATAIDIFNNYLIYRDSYLNAVLSYTNNLDYTDIKQLEKELMYNDCFAIAMARIHYLRAPEKIPCDLNGYAYYWKKFYNTVYGKGTEEEFKLNFKRYID